MNVKKSAIFALLLSACIALSGCTAAAPEKAADGARWESSWIRVGPILGVDTPDSFSLLENNEALAANGLYYASWTMGAAEPYVDAEGENVSLYDAQLYALAAEAASGAEAESMLENWMALAETRYASIRSGTEVCNGQSYTILTYRYSSDDNPYAAGASAFGVYKNYALSIELSCRENLCKNAQDILLDFLSRCHYGA